MYKREVLLGLVVGLHYDERCAGERRGVKVSHIDFSFAFYTILIIHLKFFSFFYLISYFKF